MTEVRSGKGGSGAEKGAEGSRLSPSGQVGDRLFLKDLQVGVADLGHNGMETATFLITILRCV